MKVELSRRGWIIATNICTAARILLMPVVIALAAQDLLWAGAVFVLCALLDALDGHLARRHGAATVPGRVLAAIAGFVTFAGMFSVLIPKHPTLRWTLGVYVLKELTVLLLRRRHERVTGVRVGMLWHERFAAAITYAMGTFMLFYDRKGITEFTSGLLGLLVMSAQLITLILYLVHFLRRWQADPEPITDMRLVDWQGLIMALLLAGSLFLLLFSKGDPFLSTVLWRPLYLFLQFASIVGVTGIPAFFWGEQLPRDRFDPERFPWRSLAWEKDGEIYERLGIRKWKTHVPDMSRVMAKAFPKQGNLLRDQKHMRRLVQETCSGEFVHWVLIAMCWMFPLLMDELGVVAMPLYIVGNLISIVIQRYNRPRVLKLVKRMEMRNAKAADTLR